jgi:hypothetical protein
VAYRMKYCVVYSYPRKIQLIWLRSLELLICKGKRDGPLCFSRFDLFTWEFVYLAAREFVRRFRTIHMHSENSKVFQNSLIQYCCMVRCFKRFVYIRNVWNQITPLLPVSMIIIYMLPSKDVDTLIRFSQMHYMVIVGKCFCINFKISHTHNSPTYVKTLF